MVFLIIDVDEIDYGTDSEPIDKISYGTSQDHSQEDGLKIIILLKGVIEEVKDDTNRNKGYAGEKEGFGEIVGTVEESKGDSGIVDVHDI